LGGAQGGREHSLTRPFAKRTCYDRLPAFDNRLSKVARLDIGNRQFRELGRGFQKATQFAHQEILRALALGERPDQLRIEGCLLKKGKDIDGSWFIGEDIPFREGFPVHNVWIDDVREKPPLRTISENAKLHIGILCKVIGKLLVEATKLPAYLFRFDEEGKNAIVKESPINGFGGAVLPEISLVFGYAFARIRLCFVACSLPLTWSERSLTRLMYPSICSRRFVMSNSECRSAGTHAEMMLY
jgi:hypothetical protein